MRSNKINYENRIDTKNIDQYTTSFASKYRNDGYSMKNVKFPTGADKHLLEPLYDFDDNCGKNYSTAMPQRYSYAMPRKMPSNYLVSTYVFHLDANTDPQMRELSKCANLDYMYNDYHRTHAVYSFTFRFFLPRPVE